MLPFIPQPPTPGAVATPFTVAGLPAYEKIEQSIHNNLCRFPPKLIDLPNSKRSSSASPHKFEIEQEVSSFYIFNFYSLKKYFSLLLTVFNVSGCQPVNNFYKI